MIIISLLCSYRRVNENFVTAAAAVRVQYVGSNFEYTMVAVTTVVVDFVHAQ